MLVVVAVCACTHTRVTPGHTHTHAHPLSHAQGNAPVTVSASQRMAGHHRMPQPVGGRAVLHQHQQEQQQYPSGSNTLAMQLRYVYEYCGRQLRSYTLSRAVPITLLHQRVENPDLEAGIEPKISIPLSKPGLKTP